MAIKIEKNLVALGKGDWVGSSSSSAKTKPRSMNSANLAVDAITKMTKDLEKMQVSMLGMQNQMI
jgi:hypothetical protein